MEEHFNKHWFLLSRKCMEVAAVGLMLLLVAVVSFWRCHWLWLLPNEAIPKFCSKKLAGFWRDCTARMTWFPFSNFGLRPKSVLSPSGFFSLFIFPSSHFTLSLSLSFFFSISKTNPTPPNEPLYLSRSWWASRHLFILIIKWISAFILSNYIIFILPTPPHSTQRHVC